MTVYEMVPVEVTDKDGDTYTQLQPKFVSDSYVAIMPHLMSEEEKNVFARQKMLEVNKKLEAIFKIGDKND